MISLNLPSKVRMRVSHSLTQSPLLFMRYGAFLFDIESFRLSSRYIAKRLHSLDGRDMVLLSPKELGLKVFSRVVCWTVFQSHTQRFVEESCFSHYWPFWVVLFGLENEIVCKSRLGSKSPNCFNFPSRGFPEFFQESDHCFSSAMLKVLFRRLFHVDPFDSCFRLCHL